MRSVHLILTGLSINILLLSFNRLTDLTTLQLAPYGFLRLLDFNAMLPIPLMAIILYFLLRNQIVYDSPFGKTALYIVLNILLVVGIYLFGAGSGAHEVTNYLHARFCDKDVLDQQLCQIVVYNDDSFSHYVYYLGFILLNVSLMFFEHFMPRKTAIKKSDMVMIGTNGAFISLGIFANLAFEQIGIDIWVFASVMLLSLYLLAGKVKHLPVTLYFAVSYTLGVVSTLLYKILV